MKLVNLHENYTKADQDLRAALGYFSKDDHNQANQANQYKVYYNLGINYRNLGKIADSIKAFRTAIELNENKPAAHNNSGLSNFESEAYGPAIKDFNQAIKKSGGLIAVHFNNRGLSFYHMHENVKALEDFGKAI